MIQNKERISLGEMAQQYMEVSQCWQDPDKAITENMSVEKALGILRNIYLTAMYRPFGIHLSKRAELLLEEIIRTQVELPEPIELIERTQNDS